MHVTPVGGAAAVEPAAWNRLARRGHHLHRWFVAVEAGTFHPRHLAVHDEHGLRAIVPAYLESGGLHGDLHDRWFGPAGARLARLGLQLRPSLAVVLPLGTASEPLGDVNQLPDAVFDAVFQALEQQAADDGARAVVWPFVTADQQAVLRVAARRGYVRAFAGSTARLDVEWPHFEAYVASRSRNVRSTIRRELRVLGVGGVDLRALHDFGAIAPSVQSLYRAGFRRRNGTSPAIEEGLFRRLAERSDGALWAQTAWQGSALVGASLNMVAGGRVDGCLSAFAPIAARPAVYAADLVYEPVRIACGQGYHTLELGPTALQAKQLRGATLVPRFALVRGMNRRVHAGLVALAAVVDAWTRRKERRALGHFNAAGRAK
jgi:predicted N-acyltransferase